MDIASRLAFKVRRRMAGLRADPDRFDFGRLFADCGRVLTRGGAPIALGLLVLSGPVAITASAWWVTPAGTPSETLRHMWGALNLARAVALIAVYSTSSVFISAVSLTILTGASWRDMFRPRGLSAGFVTSLSLNLATNWVTLIGPAAIFFSLPTAQLGWLFYLSLPITVALMAYAGVAVSAAIAEQIFVGPAIARSTRILRGQRWRMVSLGLGYLVLLGLGAFFLAVALTIAHVPYLGPGPGRVALQIGAMIIGAAGDIAFASFFVQARRIADGPTASELHEVFA